MKFRLAIVTIIMMCSLAVMAGSQNPNSGSKCDGPCCYCTQSIFTPLGYQEYWNCHQGLLATSEEFEYFGAPKCETKILGDTVTLFSRVCIINVASNQWCKYSVVGGSAPEEDQTTRDQRYADMILSALVTLELLDLDGLTTLTRNLQIATENGAIGNRARYLAVLATWNELSPLSQIPDGEAVFVPSRRQRTPSDDKDQTMKKN